MSCRSIDICDKLYIYMYYVHAKSEYMRRVKKRSMLEPTESGSKCCFPALYKRITHITATAT